MADRLVLVGMSAREVQARDRIIAAPLSFKEIDADGLPRHVADPERCARVAGVAVGLDTPVSTIRLLRRMCEQGYDLGAPGDVPGLDLDDDTEAGAALINALIAAGGQDEEWLTTAQLDGSHVRIAADDYRRWTADLPSAPGDVLPGIQAARERTRAAAGWVMDIHLLRRGSGR